MMDSQFENQSLDNAQTNSYQTKRSPHEAHKGTSYTLMHSGDLDQRQAANSENSNFEFETNMQQTNLAINMDITTKVMHKDTFFPINNEFKMYNQAAYKNFCPKGTRRRQP